MALSTTGTIAKNTDKIDVFLDSFSFSSMMVGEPGGATNASPGSNHCRRRRPDKWL